MALDFAERICALRGAKPGSYAACVDLTNKVELLFMHGDRARARSLVQEGIDACEANRNQILALIIKTNAVVDRINAGEYARGLTSSLRLFTEHVALNQGSD